MDSNKGKSVAMAVRIENVLSTLCIFLKTGETMQCMYNVSHSVVKRRAWNSHHFKHLRVGCLCGLKNSYSQQCTTQWHTAETKGFNIATRLATKDFKVSNGWIDSFKPLRTKHNASSQHAVHTCHPGYKNQWFNAVCCKIHTKHILAFCCINLLVPELFF